MFKFRLYFLATENFPQSLLWSLLSWIFSLQTFLVPPPPSYSSVLYRVATWCLKGRIGLIWPWWIWNIMIGHWPFLNVKENKAFLAKFEQKHILMKFLYLYRLFWQSSLENLAFIWPFLKLLTAKFGLFGHGNLASWPLKTE